MGPGGEGRRGVGGEGGGWRQPVLGRESASPAPYPTPPPAARPARCVLCTHVPHAVRGRVGKPLTSRSDTDFLGFFPCFLLSGGPGSQVGEDLVGALDSAVGGLASDRDVHGPAPVTPA